MRGGSSRSSDEAAVMAVERRGRVVRSHSAVNTEQSEEEPLEEMRLVSQLNNKSRMNREVQVRFCEGLGVRFPGSTRPCHVDDRTLTVNP